MDPHEIERSSSLLLACVDRALTGDDESVPVLAREDFVRLMGDASRAEKLALFRRITLRVAPQSGPIARVFAAAAAADPELDSAWAEYGRRRYQDSRAMVGTFESWLRPGHRPRPGDAHRGRGRGRRGGASW